MNDSPLAERVNVKVCAGGETGGGLAARSPRACARGFHVRDIQAPGASRGTARAVPSRVAMAIGAAVVSASGAGWRRGRAAWAGGVVGGVVGDPQSPGSRPGLSWGLPNGVRLYIFWECGAARISRPIPSGSFSPGPRTAPGYRGMPVAGRTRPERSEPRIIAWSPVPVPACTAIRSGSRNVSESMWRTSFAGTAICEAGPFTPSHAEASTCTSYSRRARPRQPTSVSN